MFGIGETELIIIAGFAFLLFGPDKLPGMGRTIGRALRQFRQAQEGFTQVVQAEVMDPLNEAMAMPTAKRPRQEDLDEDADLEGGEGAAGARKAETFAERKARLRAEREAREAAEKAAAEKAAAEQAAVEEAAAEEGTGSDGDASASGEALPEASAETAAEASAEVADDSKAQAEQEEPAPKSAAALYAMAPRKRAAKAEPEPTPEPEPELAPEPEAEPTPISQADEATGKEDGSEG